jgi:hypothetical protein
LSGPTRATVTLVGPPPTITSQPQAATPAVGDALRLTVGASGGNLSYQWKREGVDLPGATSATLILSPVRAEDGGAYTVRVANANGAVVSAPATVLVRDMVAARLTNLSVRAFGGTGDRLLIVGFGPIGTGTKPLLVRAVGPGLSALGVSGVMTDPRLGLFSGATEIAANDNWTGSDGRQVGAFQLTAGSRDAVLSTNVEARSFTAQVAGVGGGTGEVLVEVYDAAPSLATPRLSNLSARAQLDLNQRLIVGLSVGGAESKTFILRGVGPSLAAKPRGLRCRHGASRSADGIVFRADESGRKRSVGR